MKIPIYHVDAFTSRRFAGNPAGVCPLERWLDDDTLQSIAAENLLPAGRRLTLDFPAQPDTPCELPAALEAALGLRPREVRRARSYLAVFDHEEEVRALLPHMETIAALDVFGVIVTAPGREVDFVSRFFAPGAGVPEDAVTGSSHCTMVPYWAERLGKNVLEARQLSPRGGELHCELDADRVKLAGEAVLYLEGEIEV